ncbi:MAG: hypothetical protein Q9187_001837, partial [Circinaria calcarea]
MTDVTAHKISIEFPLYSADKFEGHYDSDDADATPGESSSRADVPGAGKKARVDCVPISQHPAVDVCIRTSTPG